MTALADNKTGAAGLDQKGGSPKGPCGKRSPGVKYFVIAGLKAYSKFNQRMHRLRFQTLRIQDSEIEMSTVSGTGMCFAKGF